MKVKRYMQIELFRHRILTEKLKNIIITCDNYYQNSTNKDNDY